MPTPETVERMRAYIAQLQEDIAVVAKLKTAANVQEGDSMPSVQFYRRFIQNAVISVRKCPVDANLTLDDVLREALTIGKGAPRTVCDRCTYIGRCSANLCAKEPDRIVRICAPDAATACRATLCFDAVELAEFLERWDGRGTVTDVDSMPNPALALGVSSGVPLNPNEIVTHLDGTTERALRWQVDMWREVGFIQLLARGA